MSYLAEHTINDSVLNKFNHYDQDDLRKIRSTHSYSQELDDYLKAGDQAKGDKLPFTKTRDMRFRTHEVTVWSGYNGSYKSMFLGQVMLGFISQGKTVCIASPEMPPVTTLYRMLSQFAGNSDMVAEAKESFEEWSDDKLWLYDQTNGIKSENLLKVIHYCRSVLKADHFVIDSLMKCGISGDDYNGQKKFVDNLCTLAKDTGIHIHLVAHRRKPQGNERSTDRFGIAGSTDITNLVDNVVDVMKNEEPTAEKSFTTMISVEKQRHYAGGSKPEPAYAFWMDSDSLQFCESENITVNTPRIWINKQ